MALKILHGSLVGDAIRRERFLRGAQKMSEIDHPAVVRVIDLDRPQAVSAAADVYGLAMTAVFALYGKDLPADTVRNSAGFIDRLDADPSA